MMRGPCERFKSGGKAKRVCVRKKGYNGGRGGNYKVSVQYNDVDFERNVPLDLIFVKVF